MRSQIEKALGLLRRSEAVEPYVFRPWLDSLSFRTIVDVYLPLSRAWALAEACDFRTGPYLERLPTGERRFSRSSLRTTPPWPNVSKGG